MISFWLFSSFLCSLLFERFTEFEETGVSYIISKMKTKNEQNNINFMANKTKISISTIAEGIILTENDYTIQILFLFHL